MPEAAHVIAMAFDAAYAPHAGAAVASIAATGGDGRGLEFLMVHDGVPERLQAKVTACAPHARFTWVAAPETLQSYAGRGYVSRATYLRLCLPELAPPELERVLYLDCDLVAHRDVRALFAHDLHGAALGAVFDYWVDGEAFARTWGLDAAHRYFNAGVLLLDLARLRSSGAFRDVIARLDQNLAHYPFLDQDALNHVFWGAWAPLDPIWNVQRAMLAPGHETAPLRAEWPRGRKPGIVHYTSEHKPWRPQSHHPYAWLYHRARAATPFGPEAGFSRLDTAKSWWRWTREAMFLRA